MVPYTPYKLILSCQMNDSLAFTCAEGACYNPAKVGRLKGALLDNIKLSDLLVGLSYVCIQYCEPNPRLLPPWVHTGCQRGDLGRHGTQMNCGLLQTC